MKCAKPNTNGEYAAKRVSNDRGTCDASINMTKKSRGSIWARAILVPLVLIFVFTLTLLGLQTGGVLDEKYDDGYQDLRDAKEAYNGKLAYAETSGSWTDNTEYFSGGSGTDDSPWTIANAKQLAFLAKIINNNANAVVKSGGSSQTIATIRHACYKLTADINLSEHYWVPIGNFNGTDKGFAGKFQGNSKIVSGMVVDDRQGASGCMGLFGYLDDRSGQSGSNYGYIIDLTVFGEIYASTDSHEGIGGIAGSSDNYWTIRRCFSGVDINLMAGHAATERLHGVGGVIGAIGLVFAFVWLTKIFPF